MSLLDRTRALLSTPRAPEYAAGVALLFSLPSLFLGKFLDDHLMHAQVRRGDPPWARFDTRVFGTIPQLREDGFYGWWVGDDFQVSLMRPLSAISHALDFTMWPDMLWLMHLENVVILVALVWLVGRLFQRLFGPGMIAGVAALIFAIDEAHGASVVWISGRNTMLAALLSVAALTAHMRWRETGEDRPRAPRLFAVLGPLCFAVGLLCAEAGIAGFGYLLAWSLARERGPWLRRLAPLAPYLVIIVAWRVVYSALGFGTRGSMIYADPLDAPLAFVAKVLIMVPAMVFAELGPPVADLLMSASSAPWLMAPVALVFVWALAPLWRDENARFLALGMVFSAVPFAAGAPGARVLLIMGLGGAGLVALAWARRREAAFASSPWCNTSRRLAWPFRRGQRCRNLQYARYSCVSAPRPRRKPRREATRCIAPRAARLGRRLVLGFLFLCNFVVAPLVFVPTMLMSVWLEVPHHSISAIVPEDAEVVAVLNVPLEINALYLKAIRENTGGRWPAHSYVLYAGMEPLEAERVDAHTLELHSEAGWAAAKFDRLTRDWDHQPLVVGDVVQMQRATVEVLESTQDGRPLRIRLVFTDSIDDVVLVGYGDEASIWSPAIGERAVFVASFGG